MVSKLLGQTIQLNEIVSTNTISLIDEDGDSPDWIEIYNPGESSVQLKGYGLYDDLDEPFVDSIGDGECQKGEALINNSSFFDWGLDGIQGTNDFGEGDFIWQPGDGWLDNNDNGIIDQISCIGDIDDIGFCSQFGSPDAYDYAFDCSSGEWNDSNIRGITYTSGAPLELTCEYLPISGTLILSITSEFPNDDTGLQGDMNGDDNLDVLDVVVMIEIILSGGMGDVGDLLNIVTG